MESKIRNEQNPFTLTISPESIQHLNQPAVEELRSSIFRYANDLIAESGRLEATMSTSNGNPEITSSMIRDANLLLRRGYSRPGKSPLMIAAQIISTLGGFLTGLIADPEKLRDPSLLITFGLLIAITISATVIVTIKG